MTCFMIRPTPRIHFFTNGTRFFDVEAYLHEKLDSAAKRRAALGPFFGNISRPTGPRVPPLVE